MASIIAASIAMGTAGIGSSRAASDASRHARILRLLENSPRAELLPALLRQITRGMTPLELATALFGAGARTIPPEPRVGYQYHAVLGVWSVWSAATTQAGRDRWLPLLWAADYYKDAAARSPAHVPHLDTLDDRTLPPVSTASSDLLAALESWDGAAAEAAITRLARATPAAIPFDWLCAYGARDFRDIGHKAIAVANCRRLLAAGAHGAIEPGLRSLVRALQNHHGDPSPNLHTLDADAAWREHWRAVRTRTPAFDHGTEDSAVTRATLMLLREAPPAVIGTRVLDRFGYRVNGRALWDAYHAYAAELMWNRPGFLALHARTMLNALDYGFRASTGAAPRALLAVQAGALLCHFRDLLGGDITREPVESLLVPRPGATLTARPTAILDALAHDRHEAARRLADHVATGADATDIVTYIRRTTIVHNGGIHDYKFAEAVIEDAARVSPPWRAAVLGSGAFEFSTPSAPADQVILRAITLLQS